MKWSSGENTLIMQLLNLLTLVIRFTATLSGHIKVKGGIQNKKREENILVFSLKKYDQTEEYLLRVVLKM